MKTKMEFSSFMCCLTHISRAKRFTLTLLLLPVHSILFLLISRSGDFHSAISYFFFISGCHSKTNITFSYPIFYSVTFHHINFTISLMRLIWWWVYTAWIRLRIWKQTKYPTDRKRANIKPKTHSHYHLHWMNLP